jgi:hypothetical protein
MPCYDGRNEELALVTKLLCQACRILSPFYLSQAGDGELFEWYRKHLVDDMAHNEILTDGEEDYNFAKSELMRINR